MIHEHELCMTQYVRGAVRRVVSDSQADSECSAVLLSPFCHPYLLSMMAGTSAPRQQLDLDNQCVKVAGGAAGPGQVGRR